MGIIFDLDQTIVDSSLAANLRKARNWSKVNDVIPRFTIYNGVVDLFDFVNQHKIRTAIVTTSPRFYCESVVRHINMKFDCIVAYHDARPIKPHPAPMLKALELLAMKPEQVVSIGDRAIDVESSRAAHIVSIGCLWGSEEKETLKRSRPDYLVQSPQEVIRIVSKYFNI